MYEKMNLWGQNFNNWVPVHQVWTRPRCVPGPHRSVWPDSAARSPDCPTTGRTCSQFFPEPSRQE